MLRRRVMMGTKSMDDYLTFTALENGTFTLTIPYNLNTDYLTSVSYSLDGGATWVTTANAASQIITITTPTVETGKTVKWKGIGTAYATNDGIYGSSFNATGRFSVSGNIMSLLFGDNYRRKVEISNSNAFNHLFRGSDKITDAGNLLLPATTLAEYCYANMFYGCTNLTTAPELPATTLASSCYFQMFCNCTKLNSVTCLATDISASYSLRYWLRYTASSGTFTKAAGVSWPTGYSGIPYGWTVVEV